MKVRVATALANGGGETPDAEVEIDPDSMEFVFTPDGPQITFAAPDGFNADTESDLRNEAATVVWYQRPSSEEGDENAWNGISDISNWGGIDYISPLVWSSSSETYFDSEIFLQKARQCLPDADYKVEIYINGRLAGSAEEHDVDVGGLTAAYVSDMGVGFCRPADWVRQEDFLPGIVFGYTSPDGTSGAYAFRIYPHRDQFADPNADVYAITTNQMSAMIDFLRDDVLPGDMEAEIDERDVYFMALTNTVSARYVSGTTGITALVGGGQTDDKAVIVGVVFGEFEALDDTDDVTTPEEQVFGSFSAV